MTLSVSLVRISPDPLEGRSYGTEADLRTSPIHPGTTSAVPAGAPLAARVYQRPALRRVQYHQYRLLLQRLLEDLSTGNFHLANRPVHQQCPHGAREVYHISDNTAQAIVATKARKRRALVILAVSGLVCVAEFAVLNESTR